MSRTIRKIYAEVAPRYELVNHILTWGLDRRWRRLAARVAARNEPGLWLDVCSGTGEMAEELERRAPSGVQVVATDISRPMLARIQRKGLPPISCAVSDSAHLPLPEASVDLVTISFATRNLNPNREALLNYLREFHRVLKPGGRFVNLETSQPRGMLLRWLFHRYVALTVKPVGYLLSGSRIGYNYLAYTLPRFYEGSELTRIFREAGYSPIVERRLLGGIAAIHIATK